MGDGITIKDLHSLLKSVIDNEIEIKDSKIKPFTDGTNFSSLLYEIDVTVENILECTTNKLKFMAKVLPEKHTQVIVNAQLGFQKEAHFYSVLVPEYKSVQCNAGIPKEEMLNIFPPYYSARLNFEDNDAVILMGDVREEGYQISCLSCGLDYHHTCLVLEELGRFHATGVALKINQPEIFNTKLKTAAYPSLQNSTNPKRCSINLQFRNQIKSIILTIPDCVNYANKVYDMLEKIDNKPLPFVKEPFATLLHNDLWINNILFQYHLGKPVAVKFIDFQTTIYNSPMREIVYFIFTSTEEQVQQQFDNLIQIYYKSFTGYLERLECEISDFSFEKFQEEIKLYGETKIKHTILLFKSICGGDFKSDNFDFELFKQKLRNLICKFVDRGWI